MSHYSKITQRKVDKAVDAVCEVYNVAKKQVLNVSCRRRPIPDARRMLVYYMHNQLHIRHYHIQNYIKSVCHATSIYHCKKLDWYLKTEKDTKNLYMLLRKKAGEFNDRLEELKIKKQELLEMQREVKRLIKKTKNND
jgi:chromosomal replication initiation ATPase DnaA